MHAVTEAALEPVAVEKGEEELEVLLLAGVGGGRHQQEVPGGCAENFAELVLLRLLHLVTEEVGGESVGLVDHDEIPVGVTEPFDDVVAPSDLVDPCDEEVALGEDVAGVGRIEQVAGEHVEAQPELFGQLLFPLADETSGGDDEASLYIAADHELLDVETGHDRLAGARIVGQEEAQRLSRQHHAVDRFDLVRERVDLTRGERQVGVKEVGQVDAPGLGGQAEKVPVAVETPRSVRALGDGEGALVGAVEKPLLHAAAVVTEHQGQSLRAMPLGGNDRDEPGRVESRRDRTGNKVFEL